MKKLSFSEAASKNRMTASQMQKITGGSCFGYNPGKDGGLNICVESSKDIVLEVVGDQTGAHWCCESCDNASWIGNCR